MKKFAIFAAAGLFAGCLVIGAVGAGSGPAANAATYTRGGTCEAVVNTPNDGGVKQATDPRLRAREDVFFNNDDELTALLEDCVDINSRDSSGNTLLHTAIDGNKLSAVKILLAHGARLDIKNTSGKTPAQYAYDSTMKAYLASLPPQPPAAPKAKPAPVSPAITPASSQGTSLAPHQGTDEMGYCERAATATTNDGRTPQKRARLRARDAIWYNHPDELTAYIENCVGVNDKDNTGSTLLHTAAERDRVEMAKILVAHGASLSATDTFGKNPASYATSPEMKALLGTPKSVQAAGDNPNKLQCAQKHQADAALCSDTACRMRANSHWQKCLKTGSYW